MKKILAIVILLFLLPIANAEFYADLRIDIQNDGQTVITGKTNSQNLILDEYTHKYTSKNSEYWILNISTNEFYDAYIYELLLPTNSQINYLKTTQNFRIDEEDGRIKLIGLGENKEFNLIVQYKIDSILEEESSLNYLYIILGILLIVILTIFLTRNKKSKTNIKSNTKATENKKENSFDISILPQRQQDIIRILQKKGTITQKKLEDEMKIPKSSVSRNIRTLEIKGLITKEQSGNTNYIKLK